MINLNDLQKQLELTSNEIKMACNSMWIKPNEDNEVTPRESQRLRDWTVGYKEMNAIFEGGD